MAEQLCSSVFASLLQIIWEAANQPFVDGSFASVENKFQERITEISVLRRVFVGGYCRARSVSSTDGRAPTVGNDYYLATRRIWETRAGKLRV
jgi:hypothetical protein